MKEYELKEILLFMKGHELLINIRGYGPKCRTRHILSLHPIGGGTKAQKKSTIGRSLFCQEDYPFPQVLMNSSGTLLHLLIILN